MGASQWVSTRARNLIERFKNKTSHCAERYQAARSALASLDPDGDWKNSMQVLQEEDIRGPGRGEDEAEGTWQLSWIWRVSGVMGASSQVNLGHLTDAESKACAARWAEEVQLLVEEMRR